MIEDCNKTQNRSKLVIEKKFRYSADPINDEGFRTYLSV